MKECLWYDDEERAYRLLDFDPNDLTKEQIIEKVKKCFSEFGVFGRGVTKNLEKVYLLNIKHLKKVK